MNKDLYIANWKMYFSFEQEVSWLNQNLNELNELVSTDIEIVVCPSFVSLNSFKNLLINKNIKLGAQNCSANDLGAYTQQIPVISLQQLNCNYCIIGHSEARKYLNESDEIIAQKASHLTQNNIIPILCVGETKLDYEQNNSKLIIESQLKYLKKHNLTEIVIAYEPVWSIGTNIIPSIEYINTMCQYIKEYIKENLTFNYRVIYGGSVSAATVTELKKVKNISGFLIGKASTDFQELKKIVLS